MEQKSRPLYHFLPPANWMNDPNGLIDWQGQYHLFYQYDPLSTDPKLMVWGHSTSRDLVHWDHLPVAIKPDTDYDRTGCWTGCAVDNGGLPYLVYTGRQGETENVCMAVSHDSLQTFVKPTANRLTVIPPTGVKLAGFRDPYVWREQDGWYMVIGSGFEGKGGAALLYHSVDFRDWDYIGPLLAYDNDQVGTMWECPNFFPLADKHVLIVSAAPLGTAHYFVGSYHDHRFFPESEGTVDYGHSFYAPQVFKTRSQRTIMFGWVWEGISKEAWIAAGWSGMQSLPRELFLEKDGSLCNRTADEIETLRGEAFIQSGIQIGQEKDFTVPVQGNSLEIDLTIAPGPGICGLKLACSDDDREMTLIGYNSETSSIFVDRERSSLSTETNRDVQEAGLSLAPSENLRLRVFLDRSVIEVFANDRVSFTSRIYPTLPDSQGLRLFCRSGRAKILSVQVWKMESIGLQ